MVSRFRTRHWSLVCPVCPLEVALSSEYFTIAAAVYSARYISSRFLPDKAIDLVDEAASSLRLAQESKPPPLEALDREIVTLQIELESLKNESDAISTERRAIVEMELQGKRKEKAELESIWLAGMPSTFLL